MYALSFRPILLRAPRFAGSALEQELGAYIHAWAQQEITRARAYPPPPPGSTYTRTGKLGSSWRVYGTFSGNNMIAIISNTATDKRGRQYMVWVQGWRQTARHRATGWRKVATGVAATIFARDVQRIINKHLAQGFGSIQEHG